MSDQQDLQRLLHMGHTCITINTFEEEYALGLARDCALNLNRPLWMWSLSGGVQDALMTGSPTIPNTDKPAQGLMHFAELRDHPICLTLDLADHLSDPRTLRVFRNVLHHFQDTRTQIIMIDHTAELPPVVREYTSPFTVSLPDEDELEKLVRTTLRREHRETPIEIDITRAGLQTILRNLRGLTRRQAERIVVDLVAEDRRLDEEDVSTVVARKRQTLYRGGLLEFVEAPVNLDTIGGLRRLKQWLQQRRDTLTDEAREYGLGQPRGVLMLGVQGAGKSLCAKAIATAWGRPLLRMDVGALYDRYVGESERRLRDAFKQAEMMAPIILWIDEIEKAFASAASRSTDGGLSQRMFGALLTWMQEHTEPVFLVATANDIEALPPELLRKGRFDEIFFVDLPKKDTRRQIFAIHLRKRKRNPDEFNLDELAKKSDGYSGAEIEQAVIAGLYTAFFEKKDLTTVHIVAALENSPPLSVTMAERIANLRSWARDRCVPAD
jgi:hypothetical protein